jgi:hypothetical protein
MYSRCGESLCFVVALKDRGNKKVCQGWQPWEFWSVFEPGPFRYDRRNAALHSVRLGDRSPHEIFRFLGSFASSQNFEYRLLASSCPPARMEHLGSHWTDFYEILVFYWFASCVEKIQVWLKFDMNNRYFTVNTNIHFLIISRSFLLRLRNASDKNCRKNRNTHFMFSNFFPENLAVYEIMWKNIVERGRPQMTGACALHAGYLRLQT